jgi:N-acetylmuramoyl-L-alanine amidase CwlA
VRRGQNKTRLTTQTKALDNTQTKTKNRHKNKQSRTSENLPKKDTKRDTSMRDLYGQLETLVQDHIENQLKHRHNGQKPYKRFSRRPSNTDLHILERHKRRLFGLIQTHVEKQHRNLQINVKTPVVFCF